MSVQQEELPKQSKLPWAKIQPVADVCSLHEVMSEQLAEDLNKKELKYVVEAEPTTGVLNANDEQNTNEPSTTNEDYLLAQMLQLEFDKEYDELLKSTEKVKNRNSRIKISFDNFKTVHPINNKQEQEIDHSTREELESDEEQPDQDEKLTFRRGVRGKGENMISKHDLALNSRQNASKVMMFPPEFETGDSYAINMRIPNKVFNELKLHSLSEEKRHNRLHDKHDKATSEMSLDPKTRLILFKMVNADILESIGGIISTGKEATIFYAPGGKTEEMKVPTECVAKVFKTTLNEFQTRDKYIRDDYRFKDRYKHLNPQKIVKLWAEKEMHNLMKMRKNGIPCPDVVMLKKHVLIMSFIGVDSVPAPKLKDALLDEKETQSAYEQSVQLIRDLYNRCNLVHADFSQFNLLWFEQKVWVIDVAESVEPTHPMGLEFLLRDCTNISNFFKNRDVKGFKSGEEIFADVTGMKFEGSGDLFLSNLQRYLKEKLDELSRLSNERETENYNFEFHFNKSMDVKKKANKKGNKHKESDSEDSSSDND